MDNQTQRPEQDLKSKLSEDMQTIKQEARSAKEGLADKAKEHAETGKEQAANTLNQLSDAIDEMASSISENDKLGLANYVHSASSRLSTLATRLQQASIDELAEDAKELARRQPAAFMLGSVVLGFGLSRFVKASAQHHADSQYDSDSAESNSGYAYGDSATRSYSSSSDSATGGYSSESARSTYGSDSMSDSSSASNSSSTSSSASSARWQ